MQNRGRLMVACPDRPGIVAAISQFLFGQGANIVHSDQHSTGPVNDLFFMRIEFDVVSLASRLQVLRDAFSPLAERYHMDYRFQAAEATPTLGILVSKEEHCLLDLLWHIQAGDIRANVRCIVSNHEKCRTLADQFGIPFHYTEVTPSTKVEAEQAQLGHLEKVDLVVLARYMQIVTPTFIQCFSNRIINIHHSFLPAFAGANPYSQAHRHGVKLIGATAHYVTEELDSGPIIEQDVQRVDHRCDPSELRRIGRLVERQVLVRAVRLHLEDRVFVHENRTVVFA